MKHRLNIVICSTRPTRIGPVFARWLDELARDDGNFDVALVDLVDFSLPVFDEPKHPRFGQYEHEHTKAWSASVGAADAFVFVTPEYNYFAPVGFVNAVTYLAREWHYKPAGFVSYGGVSGGLRAMQSEKVLLTSVKVMPIPEAVSIHMAGNAIKNGVYDAPEGNVAAAKTMLGELHRWSVALKAMRSGAV